MPAIPDDGCSGQHRGWEKGGPHLDVLEHVRVVADLPQLHDGVHQGLGAAFALQRKKRVPHQALSQGGVRWMGGGKKTVEGEALGAGTACDREMRSEELAPVEAQRLETSSGGSRDYLARWRDGRCGGGEIRLTELRLSHKRCVKPASLWALWQVSGVCSQMGHDLGRLLPTG